MMLCLPEAAGVPGLWGQPPTWPGIDALNLHVAWPEARSVSVPRGLDDPRWQGHVAIGFPALATAPASCCGGTPGVSPGFGASTNEDVAFRAVYDAVDGPGDVVERFLYLSWWIKADDVNSLVDDRLTIGFQRAAGEALILRVTPSTSPSSKVAAPVGPVGVFTAPVAGGAVNAWTENGGAPPSWIAQNTHVWVDSTTHRWAVQMRVPIGTASVATHVALSDSFKMWFEVAVELPGNLVAPYSWPRNACVTSYCGLPSKLHVPPVSVWEDFHLSTGPGDPVCPTTGFVRLSVGDVGTQNTPTSDIDLLALNVFEAKPENLTGGDVTAGQVKAEFRMANWGSVADPAAPWSLIPATGGTSNPATNSSPIATGAKGSLTLKWQLNASERAQFKPTGPKDKHQCILVTLTGSHVFNPASVWRNMDFVPASRFERNAEISNVGLGPSPSPGDPRPAYILVERLSMPAVVDHSEPDVDPDEEPDEGQDQPDLSRREVSGEDAVEVLARALEEWGDPVDRLEQEPTVRYHVYHDTGVDVTTDKGRTLRVVRPGTTFGFHVHHEGALTGWQEEVQGATAISDRFYRLEVPEEGTATVTTVIEALEGQESTGNGCLDLITVIRRIVEKLMKGR